MAKGRDRTGSIRCAVYTRKSSEEGLEQSFNSLDAQREACEAYVVSQRHEGWTLIRTGYDDGGYSGGSMDRPGLARLLADVEAGLIDVIVVYKVDRLTRSLADFAKIVERLDARQASFVSVTQAFNTTTSMGRLTLNVLLSFAQFEREVTGERIRDKVAASKRKGMWMGGNPPLGYKVHERALVVCEPEATQVCHIFTRYLALGSLRLLADELNRDGYRSRQTEGRGGCLFTRGSLAHLLANPAYVGKVRHKHAIYDGQHEAIIHQSCWEAVQAKLAAQRNGEGHVRAPRRSLLAGLVFDGEGRKMSPSHTAKGGKRYRYYVTHPGAMVAAGSAAWRISASDLERVVIERLRRWLSDHHAILTLVGAQSAGRAISAGQQLIQQSDDSSTRHVLVARLISRIDLGQEEIRLTLDHCGMAEQFGVEALAGNQAIELTASFARIRQGKDVRMVIGDAQGRSTDTVNRPLVALLAEVQALRSTVLANPNRTVASLADELGKCRKRTAQLLRIAHLAPDIIVRCIAGTQPVSLTTRTLLNSDLPICWQAQREMLGTA